jgi:hypothetical protein
MVAEARKKIIDNLEMEVVSRQHTKRENDKIIEAIKQRKEKLKKKLVKISD